jgi:hypothetical protein
MDIFLTKTIALMTAMIVVISKAWELFLRFRDGRDKIQLGFGMFTPEEHPIDALHIINKSHHRVVISDFGFIEGGGNSISVLADKGLMDYIAQNGILSGERTLENYNDRMEVGYLRSFHAPKIIGCYAKTSHLKSPVVAFGGNVGLWRCLFIRLKIKCLANN